MLHTYNNETISVDIVYKKQRKSVGLSIDGYGHIQVLAPKGMSEDRIAKLLEEKWEWIQTHRNDMQQRLEGPKKKTYESGESFLLLGKEYPIQLSQNSQLQKDEVVFKEGVLHIYVKKLDEDSMKQALKRFYYQQCKALVEKRIQANLKHFKTKPRSVQITDNTKTWGTCDSQQRLTFNWRLAMAPPEVIDYVVVHELCHMVHLNHDRSFWRLVGSIIPEYKEREQWLAFSGWKMTV